MELIRSYYFHQHRPSPNTRWVGSCINRFEACSAFTHVTACMLAKSPTRPSTPEAPTASFPSPPLRLLPGGANSSRAGLSPAVNQRLSRRTCNGDLTPTTVGKTRKATLRSTFVYWLGGLGGSGTSMVLGYAGSGGSNCGISLRSGI